MTDEFCMCLRVFFLRLLIGRRGHPTEANPSGASSQPHTGGPPEFNSGYSDAFAMMLTGCIGSPGAERCRAARMQKYLESVLITVAFEVWPHVVQGINCILGDVPGLVSAAAEP